MPKQSLVQTWLAAIGLAPHILETFEAAGIVNPKDLAELEICHYPALGVQEPGDRKKLFYLVQRVKLAVPGDDQNNNNGNASSSGNSNGSGNVSGNSAAVNDGSNGLGGGGVAASSAAVAPNGNGNVSAMDMFNVSVGMSGYGHNHNHNQGSSWQQAGERTGVEDDDNDNNSTGLNLSNDMTLQPPSKEDDDYSAQFDTEEDDDDDDDDDDHDDEDDDDDDHDQLQEQYRPLLSPSLSMDEHTSDDDIMDDSSSQEEIPSPPRGSRSGSGHGTRSRNRITNTNTNTNTIDSSDPEGTDADPSDGVLKNAQSPFRNKREEEFLKRRNERLSQLSPQTQKRNLDDATKRAEKTKMKHKNKPRMVNRNRTGGSERNGPSSANIDKKSSTTRTGRRIPSGKSKEESSLNKSTSSAIGSSTGGTRRRLRRPQNDQERENPSRSSSLNDSSTHSSSSPRRAASSSRRTASEVRKRLNSSASRGSSAENNNNNTKNSNTATAAAATNNTTGDVIKSRRTSKRLQEKKAREKLNPKGKISASLTDQDDLDSRSTDTRRTNLSSSTTTSARSSRKKVSSAPSDDNDLDSILDDKIFPVSPDSANNSDSSSNTKSKSSTQRSKIQRLSTIPSGRIVPPDTTSLRNIGDEDSIFESEVTTTTTTTTTKKAIQISSKKSQVNDKHSLGMGGRAKSTPKPREAYTQPNSLQSRSVSNLEYEVKTTKSSESCENTDSDNAQRRKSVKNSSNGMVFVHGKRKKETWTSRVDTLRQTNDQLYQDQLKVGRLDNEFEEEMRIRVVVRKRPMSRKEAAQVDDADVIHPLKYNDYGRILVYQPKTRVDLTREVETLPFAFDNVFTENSNNCEIYDDTIKNLIPGAFEGRWASVFAYGQTGSGKTFTMMGSTLTGIKARNRNVKHDKNYGLYLLAARDLFEFASKKEYSHFTIGASLFEIYGGKLFDLLNERGPVKCLENHQGRVCFPGLSEHSISSADDLMKLIEKGASNRSTGSTSANRDSSRSHAVLQLHLRKSVASKADVEHGRLTFIDLAGSERGGDTDQASRTTRLEGAEINVSLLALKEVIRALATGDAMAHIPFRGSKLTQVLKESFVGKNSRTVMVACVAPNMTNCEHTLNTLRYADRVKERNSETGELTEAVKAASKIQKKVSASGYRPVTAPPAGSDLFRAQSKASMALAENTDGGGDDGWLSDLDNDGDEDHMFKESMDELNEVLQTPVQDSAKSFAFGNSFEEEAGTRQDKRRESEQSLKLMSKKDAVAPLISTHRSIMSEMLGMVKQEMTLVNCTDEDRALIDEYLDELEQIQDKQLSMITTLRESLVEYYGQRPGADELEDSFDALLSS